MKARLLFILLLVPMLSACAKSDADPLPFATQTYADPAGIYAIPYPEGWLVSTDPATSRVVFTPPSQVHPETPLQVIVQAAETPSPSGDASAEEARNMVEQFLKEQLDPANQVYNSGELKLGSRPASLVDFGMPVGDGYATGRCVFAYLPGYSVILLGQAERETWEAFLPTFRQMLNEFVFFPEL